MPAHCLWGFYGVQHYMYTYGRYIKMALCQIEIKKSLILLPFIISFLILSWLNFIPPLFVMAQQDMFNLV